MSSILQLPNVLEIFLADAVVHLTVGLEEKESFLLTRPRHYSMVHVSAFFSAFAGENFILKTFHYSYVTGHLWHCVYIFLFCLSVFAAI